MLVVIIGAGEMGRYTALRLSRDKHNVILVDTDEKLLHDASATMDIAIRVGSGTNWQLLDELFELSPQALIALTGDDTVNLVVCSIAKQLGYPKTLARLKDDLFLNRSRIDFGRIFDVDFFLCPEMLIAQDTVNALLSPASLAVESFAHGAVQMRILTIPQKWKLFQVALKDFNFPANMIVALIRRQVVPAYGETKEPILVTIFPHGNECLLPGDEVTLIGESAVVSQVHHLFGIPTKTVETAVIVGGSRTGMHIAKLLDRNGISVTIFEKNYEKCCILAEELPHCTIVHHEGTDIEQLREEKVGSVDVLISCTGSDEINILAGLLAREIGCQKVIVLLSNTDYIPMASQLGFQHTSSPRVVAASYTLARILPGKVRSLISLYDGQAEIVELQVSTDSKIVGIPLAELGPLLPRDMLIAMIQNRGRVMIAHGRRVISPGDTVIVITSPKHIEELQEIF